MITESCLPAVMGELPMGHISSTTAGAPHVQLPAASTDRVAQGTALHAQACQDSAVRATSYLRLTLVSFS
jgi:hypothetical protein